MPRITSYALIASLFGLALPCSRVASAPVYPLNAAGIRAALVGKNIHYAPPGLADAEISEAFHQDGTWEGVYYSRGPVDFAGYWTIQNNQICVQPDPGSIVSRWFPKQRCRSVARASNGRSILIEDLSPSEGKFGPLVASVGH